MRYKNWLLVSRRYSSASNSKGQVEERCNSNFSQTELTSVGSTKPVTLIILSIANLTWRPQEVIELTKK